MEIRLSSEQADALRTLLDEALGELGYEIAATDRKQFREGLKRHRQSLREIRDAIEAAAPVGTRTA